MTDTRTWLEQQLRTHRIQQKRSLGQSFLVNDDVLEDIAAAATRGLHGPDAAVVEIGAGPGTLTRALASRVAKVVAIERDPALRPLFDAAVAGRDNVQLVEGDALEQRFGALAPPRPAIAGNLPYSITSPLLLALLAQREEIGSATVMVQREVALRLDAEPGTKAYGSLTVLFGIYASMSVLFDVEPESFQPPPAVMSTVIRFDWLPQPRIANADAPHFERTLRAAFSQRRKTLRNALGGTFKKAELDKATSVSGLDLGRRGETLTLEEFVVLAAALAD